MSIVEDRGGDDKRKGTPIQWDKMIAKCGHEDPLGYFAGTVCRKCANKGYKKATGR